MPRDAVHIEKSCSKEKPISLHYFRAFESFYENNTKKIIF